MQVQPPRVIANRLAVVLIAAWRLPVKRLVASDYKPTADVGLRLAAVALILLPLDIALIAFSRSYAVPVQTVVRDGTQYTLHSSPWWAHLLHAAIPLAVVIVLIVLGRASRRDVGLTVGKLKTTLSWILVGAVADAGMRLVGLTVLVFGVRYAGWSVRLEWLQPKQANLAEPGSALVWAVSHVHVHSPAGMAFLFLWGMILAWVFLKTRSLVAPIILHGLGNLFVEIADRILLHYPEQVRALLG